MKKQVYLFGAGGLGINALATIEKQYHVLGFVDNNTKKIGTFIENRIYVYAVSDLDLNSDLILIVSLYYKEIYGQLKALGAQNIEIYPTIRLSTVSTENVSLLDDIEAAVCRLYEKLYNLDLTQLQLCESFLHVYQEKDYLLLYNYGQAFFQMCHDNTFPSSLLDCGGQGLLTLLALECKIPLVCYYSNQQRDLLDFKSLWRALDMPLSAIVMDNCDELALYCQKNSIKFNVVCERGLYTDKAIETEENHLIFKNFCDEEKGIIYYICDRCIL